MSIQLLKAAMMEIRQMAMVAQVLALLNRVTNAQTLLLALELRIFVLEHLQLVKRSVEMELCNLQVVNNVMTITLFPVMAAQALARSRPAGHVLLWKTKRVSALLNAEVEL